MTRPSRGIGLGTMLFLIFLILKLTGAIGWSWWWVTAPLWFPAGIVVAILLAFCLGAIDESNRRTNRRR